MNTPIKTAETPLMKQYYAIKAQHPQALLLFRMGDFYETFGDDAILTSKILGIVLTRRANGAAASVELAGFPYHALDNYLPKLVRAGHKVAICEQLEDPKFAKTLVKRGVTELLSPGVAYNDQILNANENNYLASVSFHHDQAGIAFLDISTGTFSLSQGPLDYVDRLLNQFAPKEILLQKGYEKGFKSRFGDDYYTTCLDEWAFAPQAARNKLLKHFQVETLKGFGVEELDLGVSAAGACLFYLELTKHDRLGHLCSIQRIDESDYMWLDRFTIRNLELFTSFDPKGSSLIDMIDKTITPMGARLLRQWLIMPLKDRAALERRYQIIQAFSANPDLAKIISQSLGLIGDMERLSAKAAAGRLSPREAVQLKKGLEEVNIIRQAALSSDSEDIQTLAQVLDPCAELVARISRDLLPEPAQQIGRGDVIAAGCHPQLDELRHKARHGKDYILQMQQREIEQTGISSLKISYNNVFGYYIEVRNTHKDKVPPQWIRKQTLVSAERYITQELKEYEEQVLGAEERIIVLEQELYAGLIAEIQKYTRPLQQNAGILAQMDVLLGFSVLAQSNRYCRPQLFDSDILEIEQGRHPVIERLLPSGENYIANDLYLDCETQQIIIITGPNMSGKSALLRQTALIVLLAQAGSFVPAKSAKIGIVDKLFTRVGASDNISRGESTFMVEMLEASGILHNLTPRSLVLLDELGRGTSTYDGISIAWAIVEYIHQQPLARAKTLFATHYHELNEMAAQFPRVKNYHVSVKEADNKVLFLRTLKPGGMAHSFGIHVARMAGMPQTVVQTAEKMLKQLEAHAPNPKAKTAATPSYQLTIFPLEDPLLVQLREDIAHVDIHKLSPLDAFDLLRDLKKRVGL
ncbi:MAG: DNA mismatch repair protein MutS [Bacteroidales bacterium]|nr:DNA mismatch repair protein MutS [Bacteroidales bacterium]